MKQIKVTHKIAAALTAGLMVSGSGFAQAAGANNFKDMTSNINDSASQFPTLISTVSYVGGIGLGVAGIFKLKQHVENPGQTAMKDGLIRLGAGGGLLVLPYVTELMMGTIANGQTTGIGANTGDVTFGQATITSS